MAYHYSEYRSTKQLSFEPLTQKYHLIIMKMGDGKQEKMGEMENAIEELPSHYLHYEQNQQCHMHYELRTKHIHTH